MQLLHESPRATVVHGNGYDVLRELPERYVDTVIADPPYSSGGQYRGDRAADPLLKYIQNDSGARDLATFSGDNRDQRGYLVWCTLWMSEALRVAKPGAALLVFTDWRQLPTTTDAVQAGGWTWRGVAVWHKPNNRPQLGRLSAACEYAVWATAGHRPVDYPADTLQGMVSASAPTDRVHPTEKPLTVMRHLVRIAPPGGLILDPFAGSGTTLVAGLLEGRRVFGVELVEYYARMCAQVVTLAEGGSNGSGLVPSLFDEPART